MIFSSLPPVSLISEFKDEFISYKYLLQKYQALDLDYPLPIILGTNKHGKAQYYDLAKAPNLLIAGTPGSGLTVFLWSLVLSLLFHKTAKELRLIIVDCSRTYSTIIQNQLPHLLTEIIVEQGKAVSALRWLADETQRRFNILIEAKARNIDEYNQNPKVEKMPQIVLLVDELSDLISFAKKDIEESIIRITQKSQAVGIHLVLNTARVSRHVLTHLLMANMGCKIAFRTGAKADSKIVMNMHGAELLETPGDALFLPHSALKPIEIHTPLVSEQDLLSVTQWISKHQPQPPKDTIKSNDNKDSDKDPLFDQAVKIVASSRRASASLLQRRFSIGYARAARLLDLLEEAGYISKQNGPNPRMVLKKK